MGKETRDLLKKILHTQEAIMAHLKIKKPSESSVSSSRQKSSKKSTVKKTTGIKGKVL